MEYSLVDICNIVYFMTISSIHTHLDVRKVPKREGQKDVQTDGHGCILNESAQGANMMRSPFT